MDLNLGSPFLAFDSQMQDKTFDRPQSEAQPSAGIGSAHRNSSQPFNFSTMSQPPTPRPFGVTSRSHGNSQPRRRWESWEVLALLECKRDEAEEYESQTSREHMLTGAAKWQRISERLRVKGVIVDGKQCKGMWDSLLATYKKVKDWNAASGNAAFHSLSAQERKDNTLPIVFEDEWYNLLDQFYGNKPCMNPNLAESSPPSDPPPEDSDDTDNPSSSYSTGKRKRTVSQNTRALVSAMERSMDSFGLTLKDIEATSQNTETRMLDILERNCSKICDVLSQIAGAILSTRSQ